MLGVKLVQEQRAQDRQTRSPKHKFQLRTRPFQISPFMIAPVLPGETLVRFMHQARIVTDPIDNPIIGWKKEYGLWYVKLTDLYDRETIISMLIDPTASMAALDDATSLNYYHVNGTMSPAINWPLKCTTRIVDEYFRYEGEAAGDFTINTVGPAAPLYAAPIKHDLYVDSLINEDALEATTADVDLANAGSEFGTAVRISEVEKVMREWQLAKMHGVVEMTYEEWCRQHGVSIGVAAELHKPELIEVWGEWSYPTNTIDPTNGTPRSAVSWAMSNAPKRAFAFREPGFIVGLTWCRPKVYYENLTSHASMLLNTSKDWSVRLFGEDPMAGFKAIDTAGDPPVDANTDAYYLDVKDVFLHGDQFINFALTDGAANIVALPTAAGVHRYLTADAELDGLFVGASPSNQIREDGICQLHIKSALRETTPNFIGSNDI